MLILVLQTFSRFSIAHHFRNHGSSLQHGRGGGRMWHYDGIQVFRAGRAGLAHRKMHTTASGSHICTVSKYEKKSLLNFEFCNTIRIWLANEKKISLAMSNRVTLLFSTTPHASRVTAYVIECAYSAWANLIKKVSGTIPTKRIFYFDLRPPLKT